MVKKHILFDLKNFTSLDFNVAIIKVMCHTIVNSGQKVHDLIDTKNSWFSELKQNKDQVRRITN